MLSAADFEIIKDGVDTRLEIIQHIKNGFLNITKMATLVNNLKQQDIQTEEENEQPDGIPSGSLKQTNEQPARISAGYEKRPRDWFQNQTTKDLITEFKIQSGLECVHYELAKGTPKKFAGIYIHEYLYDHFMMWLDPKYAIKVSIILKSIRGRLNDKLKRELNSMTEARDDLQTSFDKFREEQRLRDERSYDLLP